MPTSRPNHRAEREALKRALGPNGELHLRLNPDGHFEPVVADEAPVVASPPPPPPSPEPVADTSVREVPDHQREIEALKLARPSRPAPQPAPQPPSEGPLHRLGLRRPRAEPELDAFGRPVRREEGPPRSSP